MLATDEADAALGEVLADVVEAAGAEILPLWRSDLQVDRKADESPVTEADRRGEALILRRLRELFPDVPVVSEEDASEFGTPVRIGPRFFLVDPLELKSGGGDPDGDPINVIARVTELLRVGRDLPHGRRLPVPAAVALTKIDALPLEGALQRHRAMSATLDLNDREAVHEQVRALLHDWQAGELDRYLAHEYADYGLFGLSALGGVPREGAVGTGGIRPYRVEDPLLWLLYRFGMLDGTR